MQIDDKRKYISFFGKGPTQGLHDTALTAEGKYHINFTKSGKRFVLTLQYNGSHSFLFVNATKVYQFKAKNSGIKNYALCLSNVSKYFIINNMNKSGWKGVINFFSVDFNPIDTNDILDIHKYLMKRTRYKMIILASILLFLLS